jgi:raffinose/stachyose/melibiose transport system substrate-binding protein
LKALPGALLAALLLPASAGTLVIESWRVDDKALWENVLLPAFARHHPGVTVKFAPTAPTGYDAALAGRLARGTAGDLIACRPFDVSLALYRGGHLDRLDGKQGLQNFDRSSLVAWQTDDGKDTFCMPVASVIHGFFYNKDIFRRHDLQPPRTVDDFFRVLDVLKKAGVTPLALGTAEQWESSQIVYTNIGPNFWRGEEGRKALIAGRAKLTDRPFVDALDFTARLGRYLPADAAKQTYAASQARFASGGAAVYPAGSWDIAHFSRTPGLALGVFPPPLPREGAACHISDHMDLGLGVNRNSKNKEDAYKFMAWVGSQEFADLYTNRLTGFFTLSHHLIAVRDPVAKQMAEWRKRCASTIRVNAQVLDRGQPGMEAELWAVTSQVLNGSLAPGDGAVRLQNRVEQGRPGQK